MWLMLVESLGFTVLASMFKKWLEKLEWTDDLSVLKWAGTQQSIHKLNKA